jgi:AraC-like DNA-binding protein
VPLHTQDDVVLAAQAGDYLETLPIPALRAHIRCAWRHRVPVTQVGPVAVVPDGCVDLIWHDGRLSAVGPDIVTAHHTLAPGSIVLGLRFQPGAALHWLGLPMSEILGRSIALDDIRSRTAQQIITRLQDSQTPAAQHATLQICLAEMAGDITPPSPETGFIFRTMQGDATAKIDRLLHHLAISPRSLHRRSCDHFGYGPKMLERILRFQKVLQMARRETAPRLSALAADAGYADQAHLSREVRSLCGITAGTLLRQVAA